MVSVLMCTYNREKYLRRAIDSVLGQTYGDFEFIIVDDGSTDGSEALVKSYRDARIHYIKQEENVFYCCAANRGLKYCKGKYIAFMNSDDEWLKEKLEKQVAFMEANREYGACFSAVFLMDNEGRDVTDECPDMRDSFARRYHSQKECMRFFFWQGNSLCHPSAMVRKEVLEKVGGFNLMYCQLADFELWVKIASRYPIYVTQDRLLRFRWDVKGKEQVSSSTEEHQVRSYNQQVRIGRELLEWITDEQVVEYFGEDFVNQSSASHLELEFERCFLLLKCNGGMEYPKAIGIDRLERVLNMPGAMEVLRNHFGMSIFEIYEMDKEHVYPDPWKKKEYEMQRDKIARLKEENRRLKRQIAEYAGSTSWKLTEPLRRLGRRAKSYGKNCRFKRIRSKTGV